MANRGYLSTIWSFNKDIWLWLFAWFCGLGFAYFGVYTVAFNLYIVRLGYGPDFVGLLQSTGSITGAIFSIPAGILGTRFGIKRFMIIGMMIFATGFVLLWLSGSIQNNRFILIVSNVVLGIGVSAYLTNAFPVFTAIMKPDERTLGFTLMAVAEPLGGLAGSIVGGSFPLLLVRTLGLSIEGPEPFRHTLLVPAVLLFAGSIGMMMTKRSSSSMVGNDDLPTAAIPRRALKRVVITIVVIAFAGATRIHATGIPRLYFNLFAERVLGFNVASIGSSLGSSQLVAIPLILAVPIISNRIGIKPMAMYALLITVASAVLMALVPIGSLAVTALFIGSIGLSLGNPAFNQFSQEIFEPRFRPIASGAIFTALNLGLAGFNLLAGQLISRFGFTLLFLLSAASTLTGVFVFGVYFRKPRGEFAGGAV